MIRAHQYGDVTRYDLARTLAGKGRYWTTCYRVGQTMIDTGCAHTAHELTAELADHRLQRILNTHTHEDHIGANGRLQRRHDELEVLAHPLALPVLTDPSQQRLHPYRKVMWGWPEPCAAGAVTDGDVVQCGDAAFEVLHTPGHAADHICFYEPKRGWLFTGDLYVGGKDRALRAGYDIWQIIASLRRVAQLEIRQLFPGSARVPDHPKRALAAKIEHLERLGERVCQLDRDGVPIARIARTLCGGPMFIELLTLGHFSRRRLVLSYLGRNPDPAA
jgi:glyoxylase-like metal-dependent hydrolase (beta-lactamase superfamily II)